jgi:hypothetical protein
VLLHAVTVVPLWASILLALSSPAVAAIAVWVGKRQTDSTLAQQHQQLKQQAEQVVETLRHERQRDDLSEVRRLLDDAARALAEADRCHRDIYDDLGNEEKRDALMKAGRELEEIKQRIAIRFGPDHEVTHNIDACADVSLEVFGATTHWKLGDHQYAIDQAKGARDEFEVASRAFVTATVRYAGVDLPETYRH